MVVTGWLSWFKHRGRFRNSARPHRGNHRFVPQLLQLEERCVLSDNPFGGVTMPTTPDKPGDVLFIGPDHGPNQVPLKTITFTNNTSKIVFPFLLESVR
jgi:hypothetical protein